LLCRVLVGCSCATLPPGDEDLLPKRNHRKKIVKATNICFTQMFCSIPFSPSHVRKCLQSKSVNSEATLNR
jgi:hypothetical protein